MFSFEVKNKRNKVQSCFMNNKNEFSFLLVHQLKRALHPLKWKLISDSRDVKTFKKTFLHDNDNSWQERTLNGNNHILVVQIMNKKTSFSHWCEINIYRLKTDKPSSVFEWTYLYPSFFKVTKQWKCEKKTKIAIVYEQSA